MITHVFSIFASLKVTVVYYLSRTWLKLRVSFTYRLICFCNVDFPPSLCILYYFYHIYDWTGFSYLNHGIYGSGTGNGKGPTGICDVLKLYFLFFPIHLLGLFNNYGVNPRNNGCNFRNHNKSRSSPHRRNIYGSCTCRNF